MVKIDKEVELNEKSNVHFSHISQSDLIEA